MIENNEIDSAMEKTICTVSLACGQPDDIIIINYDDVMGLPQATVFCTIVKMEISILCHMIANSQLNHDNLTVCCIM